MKASRIGHRLQTSFFIYWVFIPVAVLAWDGPTKDHTSPGTSFEQTIESPLAAPIGCGRTSCPPVVYEVTLHDYQLRAEIWHQKTKGGSSLWILGNRFRRNYKGVILGILLSRGFPWYVGTPPLTRHWLLRNDVPPWLLTLILGFSEERKFGGRNKPNYYRKEFRSCDVQHLG